MTVVWSKFENGYEISTEGEVRSVDRVLIRKDTGTPVFYKGQILKQALHRDGYKTIRISVSDKKSSYFVHRLVEMHFRPNPDNKPQVNHKDCNKTNNHISNLEWVDNSENQLHARENGLIKNSAGIEHPNFKGVIQVFRNNEKVDELFGSIDMRNKGFDPRLVNACLKGKRKTHRGCTFVRQST